MRCAAQEMALDTPRANVVFFIHYTVVEEDLSELQSDF